MTTGEMRARTATRRVPPVGVPSRPPVPRFVDGTSTEPLPRRGSRRQPDAHSRRSPVETCRRMHSRRALDGEGAEAIVT